MDIFCALQILSDVTVRKEDKLTCSRLSVIGDDRKSGRGRGQGAFLSQTLLVARPFFLIVPNDRESGMGLQHACNLIIRKVIGLYSRLNLHN